MNVLRKLLPTAAVLLSMTASHAQHEIIVPTSGLPIGPPSTVPQAQLPQKQSPGEAACIAAALGRVPQGANVTKTSINFTRSVTPIAADTFYLYIVMIDAETAGQRFQYRYICREWRGSVDISPAK